MDELQAMIEPINAILRAVKTFGNRDVELLFKKSLQMVCAQDLNKFLRRSNLQLSVQFTLSLLNLLAYREPLHANIRCLTA